MKSQNTLIKAILFTLTVGMLTTGNLQVMASYSIDEVFAPGCQALDPLVYRLDIGSSSTGPFAPCSSEAPTLMAREARVG